MDLSLFFAIFIVLFSAIYLLLSKGWTNGAITLLFILGFLVVYFATLKLWGEEGKKYLAIVLSTIAVFLLYLRKKQGKGVWW